jgi:acetylglutamate kinase
MEEIIRKAQVLVEAFPYIQAFKGKIVVIKYGGRALLNKQARRNILEDIAFMSIVGIRPILVHGGGHRITERIAKSGGKVQFIEGKRVTDKKTIKVVYEVLKEVNTELVEELNSLNAKAIGIDPLESKTVMVEPESKKLGYVGKVKEIDKNYLLSYIRKSKIPVLMPIGVDSKGTPYNINADDFASELAISLKAEKLVLLTDVRGILREREDESSLIPTLHVSDVDELIRIGAISGGMIPKVRACQRAIDNGVRKVHILDGRIPHVILLEVFTTEGVGTEIVK